MRQLIFVYTDYVELINLWKKPFLGFLSPRRNSIMPVCPSVLYPIKIKMKLGILKRYFLPYAIYLWKLPYRFNLLSSMCPLSVYGWLVWRGTRGVHEVVTEVAVGRKRTWYSASKIRHNGLKLTIAPFSRGLTCDYLKIICKKLT